MSISGGDYAQATFTHTDGTNTYLDAATNSQALYLANYLGSAIYLVVPVRFQNNIAAFKGISTAGLGVPAIFKLTAVKAETGADANVFTYTPPAVAGVYRASFAFDVSAATAATIGFTLSYKDSTGTAISALVYEFASTGSPGSTLVFTGAGNSTGSYVFNIDASATNIVAGLSFTGTSFTGKVTAVLEQLA